MFDEPIMMAVASYRSMAAALEDFDALEASTGDGSGRASAALIAKGADGQLVVDRHYGRPHETVWAGVVLGGALTVVAAPVGIAFLVPLVHTPAQLGGVGAIARHFWMNVPKHQLRQMSELLESSQAALVVVTGDQPTEELEQRFSGAAAAVLNATQADLDREFIAAVDEAAALG